MHFESIELDQANGIRFGLRLEGLSPVVNVICGPNGSGKTTLCRAIRGVLWPGAPAVPKGLAASVTTSTGTARAFGGTTHWPAPCPALPIEQAAPCYTLTKDELRAIQKDNAVVEAIEREFAGGHDFKSATKVLARAHPVGFTNLRKAIENAEGKVESALATQSKLRTDLGKLADLEQREHAGKEARIELGRVRDAAELGEVRLELEETRAKQARRPSLCARLRGDEEAELRGADADVAKADGNLRGCRKKLDDMTTELELEHPHPERLDEKAFKVARSRLEDAKDAAGKAVEARRRATALLEGVEADRTRLGMRFDPENSAPPPGSDTLKRLDELLDLQTAITSLRKASIRLDDHGGAVPSKQSRSSGIAIAIVAVIVVGGVVAIAGGGITASVLGGLVAGLVAIGVLLLKRPDSGRSDHTIHKEASRVRDELEAACKRCDALTKSLENDGITLDDERPLLARDVAERLGRLSAAHASAATASAEASELEAARTRLLAEVRDGLSIDGIDERELEAALESLAQKRAARIAAAEKQASAQVLFDQAEDRYRAIFERVELEPGDEGRRLLLDALPHLEAWKEGSAAIRVLEDRCHRLEERLEEGVDLADRDAAQLKALSSRLTAEIEAAEDAVGERAILQDRVKEKASSTTISQLEGVVAARVEDFDLVADKALDAELASYMLRQCREKVASQADSNQMLGRVRSDFARVTNEAYEVLRIVINEESGALSLLVRDKERGEDRTADELSSGPRSQLLLCARLSILSSYEAGGAPLPIILDDALADIDPVRFKPTVDLLIALAGEGRQIFYFTDEPGHAQTWVDRANERGIDVHACDLLSGVDLAAVTLAPTSSVPRPEPDDPVAYARLVRAARPHVHDSPDVLHVVHLLPDHLADRAYPLLVKRAHTLGVADVHADGDEFLTERIAIARALLDQFAIGIDHEVDVAALTSDLSEKNAMRITEFVAEHDCTLRDLIGAVEDEDPHFKGIRGRESIIDTLRSSDMLDDRAPRDVKMAAGFVCATIDPQHHSPDELERYARYLEELLAPSRRV